jgi:hypothetical protein
MKAGDRIRKLLECAGKPLGGADIASICNVGSGTLYPELQRLENAGEVTSFWQPGDEPRRRMYQLVAHVPIVTYPPEMLPVAGQDDDAEVIVQMPRTN